MPAGFFISDQSIKIAKLEANKPRLFKVPLEAGIIQEGVIRDEAKLKAILLKIAHKIGIKEIIFGIAERDIFTKTITVRVGEGDLEQQIAHELESFLPLPPSQSYTDWQVIEKREESERILVTSVSAELLDRYLSLFGAVSVHVVGIEPIAHALARKIPQSLGKSLLIIALCEDESLMTVINQHGKMELTAILPHTMVANTADFFSEITTMRSYYEKKGASTQSVIEKVYLTGDRATEEIKNQISQHLSVPVEILRITRSTVSAADSVSFFPVFSLIDLPIVFPKDHIDINLLPGEAFSLVEKVRASAHVVHLLKIATAALAFFCFSYLLIGAFLFWNLRLVDNDITKQQNLLKKNDATGVVAKVTAINKSIAVVAGIKAKSEHFETLAFLADKTPSGITITHYRINLVKNQILITGLSLEREILLAFKNILETDGKFQNVNIPLTSVEKKGSTTFSLSFEGAKQQ